MRVCVSGFNEKFHPKCGPSCKNWWEDCCESVHTNRNICSVFLFCLDNFARRDAKATTKNLGWIKLASVSPQYLIKFEREPYALYLAEFIWAVVAILYCLFVYECSSCNREKHKNYIDLVNTFFNRVRLRSEVMVSRMKCVREYVTW